MSTTEIRTTKKRSTVTPTTMIVQKTPVGMVRQSLGGYGGGNVIQRTVRTSTYSAPPLKPGVVGQATKEGVSNVMQTRTKEKQEMSGLNCKLADYIEKVRFLEANCKALTAEIDKLRKAKGYDQKRVSELYMQELQECRDKIDDLQKDISPKNSQIVSLEDMIDTLREK